MADDGGRSPERETPNHDELIAQFCESTGGSPEEAQHYLSVNHWDINTAASEFFVTREHNAMERDDDSEVEEAEAEPYTGPRTLDGRPAPSAKKAAGPPPTRRTGVATLGTLPEAPGDGHGHDDSDDDTDDDDIFARPQEPRDLFTGGEKSGLAVQDPNHSDNNPRKLVNDIIKQAKAWVKLI